MTEENDKPKTTLSLGNKQTLELKKSGEAGSVRQSFSHGRSKVVTFEVRKTRTNAPVATTAKTPEPAQTEIQSNPAATRGQSDSANGVADEALKESQQSTKTDAIRVLKKSPSKADNSLTQDERTKRINAYLTSQKQQDELEQRLKQEQELGQLQSDAQNPNDNEYDTDAAVPTKTTIQKIDSLSNQVTASAVADDDEEDQSFKPKKMKTAIEVKRIIPTAKRSEPRRRTGKITVTQALDAEDAAERVRSLASVKRAREREKLRMQSGKQEKVLRDVTIPDFITVQELASRMAERGSDVVKALIRMGVMATINETIDADTAEIIVSEFGHTPKRSSEAAVEIGLEGITDDQVDLLPRSPVVTVMGHVDHGKTSLLDALRQADVAAHEAGGITQHIGAYQVTLPSQAKITFIDTPGHEAFSEMRSRGATVTDIVVLVVAADDGIMPQTIEAIRHAKEAKVPIVVAVNKVDLPGANPARVRQELLQHDLVIEELGGDILAVDVSAKTRFGLEKLEEAIMLQAEVLDLKANPNRTAEGTVIEAKLDRGRGPVGTILVQKGTLRVGDIFVAGGEWGKVRALIDGRGNSVKSAGPSVPVEVLGLQGTPNAGDELRVVDSEPRAREIASFRQRRNRDAKVALAARGTVEQMLSKIAAGEVKEFPIIIKSDVQGSSEAINAALHRLDTNEVAVRILHSGVGGINESDITLARAAGALVIAFNVRANVQARELAKRDAVDIRYYSIIYALIDDIKGILSGMLAPTISEKFLGYAEIRKVFEITRIGKVAGTMITEGIVKRGSKIRLLRDNVVIHEGNLTSLRRVKDEVREVKQGFECGMAFENYNDLKEGDQVECYEMIESARHL